MRSRHWIHCVPNSWESSLSSPNEHCPGSLIQIPTTKRNHIWCTRTWAPARNVLDRYVWWPTQCMLGFTKQNQGWLTFGMLIWATKSLRWHVSKGIIGAMARPNASSLKWGLMQQANEWVCERHNCAWASAVGVGGAWIWLARMPCARKAGSSNVMVV